MSMISCLLKISEKDLNTLLKDPSDLSEKLYDEENETNNCDLDKAWHAIHFLLNGSVWGVTSSAGSLLLGGELISDEDVGYGPARYFTINQVSDVSNALNQITETDFFSKYGLMLEQGDEIYPSFQDSKEDREYIGSYFKELKEFCATAVKEQQCLISYLA